MKRTICLILVFALFSAFIPASAAGDIWFIAVDDTIPLTLTGGQTPFYSGGLLYVPCSAFDSDVLSVFYRFDSSSNILSMYNDNNRIIFDLNVGTVLLKDGTEQNTSALSKNGAVFVPVYFVSSSFGIGCVELEGSGGYPIIRLTTGNEIYDDDKFVTQSKNLVDDRVSKYLSSVQTPEPTPTPTPSVSLPPAASETPSPSHPPEEFSPPEDEPSEPSAPEIPDGVDCALFIDGSNYSGLTDVIGRTSAIFTFTPDSLAGADETVRAIIAAGYDIALALDISDTDAALSDLASCNQSLRRMAMYKSMMVVSVGESVSSDSVAQLNAIGCQVWTDLISADDTLDLTAYEGPVAVYCSSISAQGLSYFIKAAAKVNSSFLKVKYTTAPFDTPVKS